MVHELPEKVACGQPEAAPEVLEEDDHLPILRRWHQFTP
jgi:hypothetical protein